MTIKKILLSCLFFPGLVFAETEMGTSDNVLKQLTNVRISMQRMLKSSDEKFYLSLFAGVPKPHGVIYQFESQQYTKLNGTQKGDQIELSSALQGNLENITQLSGTLNSNTGILDAILKSGSEEKSQPLKFEPMIKAVDKPILTFKFFGVKADNPTHDQLLTRVDVMNKADKTLFQTLTGFTAFPNSIGYLDINFDGYYDVILSDLSQDRTIADRRYIYWMYNPKTKQYQRSSQLEKIVGLPELDGINQQINFGNGQIYQVKNGLLSKLENTVEQ